MIPMVDGFKLEELPDRRPYQEPPDLNPLHQNAPFHLGVDVAKATLAFACTGFNAEYPNTTKGHDAILKDIQRHLKSSHVQIHVVMESTGGYQRPFLRFLHTHSIAVSVVNARQVRDFAKAMGQLTSTGKGSGKCSTGKPPSRA